MAFRTLAKLALFAALLPASVLAVEWPKYNDIHTCKETQGWGKMVDIQLDETDRLYAENATEQPSVKRAGLSSIPEPSQEFKDAHWSIEFDMAAHKVGAQWMKKGSRTLVFKKETAGDEDVLGYHLISCDHDLADEWQCITNEHLDAPVHIHAGNFCSMTVPWAAKSGYQFDNLWIVYKDQFRNGPDDCWRQDIHIAGPQLIPNKLLHCYFEN